MALPRKQYKFKVVIDAALEQSIIDSAQAVIRGARDADKLFLADDFGTHAQSLLFCLRDSDLDNALKMSVTLIVDLSIAMLQAEKKEDYDLLKQGYEVVLQTLALIQSKLPEFEKHKLIIFVNEGANDLVQSLGNEMGKTSGLGWDFRHETLNTMGDIMLEVEKSNYAVAIEMLTRIAIASAYNVEQCSRAAETGEFAFRAIREIQRVHGLDGTGKNESIRK